MRRIVEYRKLMNITQETTLADLKIVYRNLMKEWHPDKFADNEEKKEEAEQKSKEIIEAYHFLVSVSPETHEANKEEYTRIISTAAVENVEYKGTTLKIFFQDGSVYEYFNVPKATYNKLMNSGGFSRFARRHIFHEFLYRPVSKAAMAL